MSSELTEADLRAVAEAALSKTYYERWLFHRMADPARVLALLDQVERVEKLAARWEADAHEHLITHGQHLMGGAVESCVDHLRAVLAGPTDQTDPKEPDQCLR